MSSNSAGLSRRNNVSSGVSSAGLPAERAHLHLLGRICRVQTAFRLCRERPARCCRRPPRQETPTPDAVRTVSPGARERQVARLELARGVEVELHEAVDRRPPGWRPQFRTIAVVGIAAAPSNCQVAMRPTPPRPRSISTSTVNPDPVGRRSRSRTAAKSCPSPNEEPANVDTLRRRQSCSRSGGRTHRRCCRRARFRDPPASARHHRPASAARGCLRRPTGSRRSRREGDGSVFHRNEKTGTGLAVIYARPVPVRRFCGKHSRPHARPPPSGRRPGGRRRRGLRRRR